MHIGIEWKRESRKIEKIKSKLQKVEKLCHFTMYENELELSSVRGLCVKHVSLGREKKHKCICKQEYIVDWILRINARIEKVSTFSLSQFSLLPLLFVLGNFFSSYHICLPLLFNSKNYRFCYFENRLYVPAWFSFVHIHSQERLAAVVVLKISDFLNDIFSRETYSLKTTCFVAQYLNYLSTRLKSNCLHVFNQNM